MDRQDTSEKRTFELHHITIEPPIKIRYRVRLNVDGSDTELAMVRAPSLWELPGNFPVSDSSKVALTIVPNSGVDNRQSFEKRSVIVNLDVSKLWQEALEVAKTGISLTEKALFNGQDVTIAMRFLPSTSLSSKVRANVDRPFRVLATLGQSQIQAQSNNPQVLGGHASSINAVAYSPDGRYIASASTDTTIKIWDVQSGSQIGEPIRGHTESVLCVTFSPDGQRIASGSEDTTIRIWDTKSRTFIAQLEPNHGGIHNSDLYLRH
ncbi:WD40 repeat-like protein [Serendipita vermifera]|nr:WD40 repeat-like protein [Serendipita vermifera]